MNLPIVLRPEAVRDVEEARDHLELQRVGLGQSFLERLNDTLAIISGMPKLYGVAWRNVRAARLRRFPHVVYYRVHNNRAEVLAVMHGRRDASVWQNRT